MSFEPIRRIIPSFVRGHGLEQPLQAQSVVEVALEVFTAKWGAERASVIVPISFVNGCLKLEVTSPAAMQELRVQEAAIMNEINRRMGSRVVRSLRASSKGF